MTDRDKAVVGQMATEFMQYVPSLISYAAVQPSPLRIELEPPLARFLSLSAVRALHVRKSLAQPLQFVEILLEGSPIILLVR